MPDQVGAVRHGVQEHGDAWLGLSVSAVKIAVTGVLKAVHPY